MSSSSSAATSKMLVWLIPLLLILLIGAIIISIYLWRRRQPPKKPEQDYRPIQPVVGGVGGGSDYPPPPPPLPPAIPAEQTPMGGDQLSHDNEMPLSMEQRPSRQGVNVYPTARTRSGVSSGNEADAVPQDYSAATRSATFEGNARAGSAATAAAYAPAPSPSAAIDRPDASQLAVDVYPPQATRAYSGPVNPFGASAAASASAAPPPIPPM